MTTTTSLAIQAGNAECQDLAAIVSGGDRTILVLADGAGGISGGAKAAELFVQMVRAAADQLGTTSDCVRLLETIDQELARQKDCGETTGVIVIIDSSHIFGASIGDSAAWLFTNGGAGELTYGQARKPLIGSGGAFTPRTFIWPVEDGVLVVASDGLWKYTKIEAIKSRLQSRGDTDLALRLTELVRLRSGAFPDDVAVITCRIDTAPG